MAFPLSEEQRQFAEEILGTAYNGKPFDYDSIRVRYTAVSENELRKTMQEQNITYQLTAQQEQAMINLLTQTVSMGLSLPGGRIFLPGITATDLTLVNHEIFHQFQYMNMGTQTAFQSLVNEQIGKALVDPYNYQINLAQGKSSIQHIMDISTLEGQAEYIQDFAQIYINGKNSLYNNQLPLSFQLPKDRARALYNSGFDSRAILDILRNW